MKNSILVTLLIISSLAASANPYVRLMDTKDIHQSAGLLIDPNGHSPNAMVTDVCTVTHSTSDGSIVTLSWQGLIPPENLCLLEFGAGGSSRIYGGRLTGNALVHAGTSVNFAPQLGALLLMKVDENSSPALRAVKDAMLNVGGNGVRLGWGISGRLINDGVFQSFKEALPGRGIGDIINKNQKLEVGYSWGWK